MAPRAEEAAVIKDALQAVQVTSVSGGTRMGEKCSWFLADFTHFTGRLQGR
jgi:hypothetical protein